MVTKFQIVLLIFTGSVIAGGVLMAACVCFVLNDVILPVDKETETPNLFSERGIPRRRKDLNSFKAYKRIKDYKWLVSISIPLYFDTGDYLYACTGVIIRNDTVLTGEGCYTSNPLFNQNDLHQASVRSMSDYYSYGGKRHAVISKTNPGGCEQFIELTVIPSFPEDMIVQMVDKFEKDDEMEVVGWSGLRTSENLLRFEKFDVENWTPGKCEASKRCSNFYKQPQSIKSGQCSRSGSLSDGKKGKTGDINGRALIRKSDHSLIGMEFEPAEKYEDNEHDFHFMLATDVEFTLPLPFVMCKNQPGLTYYHEVDLFKPE